MIRKIWDLLRFGRGAKAQGEPPKFSPVLPTPDQLDQESRAWFERRKQIDRSLVSVLPLLFVFVSGAKFKAGEPSWSFWICLVVVVAAVLYWGERGATAKLEIADVPKTEPVPELEPDPQPEQVKPKKEGKGVNLKKDVMPWRSIEAGFQRMTYNELAEQKKYRDSIGDTDIVGRIRNLQKHWEKSPHWEVYKQYLKDMTPGQVKSYYP